MINGKNVTGCDYFELYGARQRPIQILHLGYVTHIKL
jgi:hypothetical protein